MQNLDVFSLVAKIAEQIAHCDFRVTLQRYMLGDYPWIITVGENHWQRHLVLRSVSPDGKDAILTILSPEQSDKFGYDIDVKDFVAQITLGELTKDQYTSVKKALTPSKAA